MEEHAPATVERLLAHREWVRRVARALVRDEALAEDLEQEVWLEALRRPPPSDRSPGGWLAAALRHNLFDRRRSEARRRAREEAAARPEAERSPADLVAEAETQRRVVAAVLDLPEPSRGAVLLRWFEGLPVAEVARRQGVPLETARTRLRRGIAALRERLDRESGGDRAAWVAGLAPLLGPGGASGTPRGAPSRIPVPLGAAVMTTKAVAVAVLAVAVLTAAFLLHGPRGPAVPPGHAPPRGTAADAPAGPPAGGTTAAAHPPAGEPAPVPAAAGAAPGHPPGTGEIPADRAGFAVEVVDEEGAPVRAGTVEVSPSLFDFERLEKMAEELKAWRDVLEPGDLALANPFVVADLPGKVSGVRLTAAARAPGFAPAGEEEFALRAGTLVRVRLVLARERPLEVVVLEAEGGGPVAGARVVSLSERSRRNAWNVPEDAEAPGRAVTGPDGRCRVEGLGPGLHDFEVLAPGFRAAKVRDRDLAAGPLAVRLERSRDAGVLEVLVLAPDGTPVRGMGVRLQAPGRRLPVPGRTDADGIARFEGLGEGFPFVSVDPEEWAKASRDRSWPKDPGPSYSAALKLGAGETRRAVLGWARGDAEIRVEVVDGAGKPAPGVRVQLAGPSRREADTGADGRAAFAGLQAGAYRVVTRRAEEWWEREDLDLPPAGKREARVALGDRVLRGVVREPGGKPVRGAQVAIYGPRYRSVATGEDGAFEVREALPGSYEVHAAADGYAGGMARADVPAGGEAAPVQVLLQRGGRVLVRPAGGPGAAVPQDLRLENAEGEECTLLEEAAGPFPRVTPLLAPGTYVLRWTAPDGTPRRLEVPVRDGEDAEVPVGEP